MANNNGAEKCWDCWTMAKRERRKDREKGLFGWLVVLYKLASLEDS
jgi:hypothetical protein